MDLPPSTSKAVKPGDKMFETSLQKWFDEVDSGSDGDEDKENTDFELSDHNSESEQSASDLEDVPEDDSDLEANESTTNMETADETSSDSGDHIPRKHYYYGRNKFKWSNIEPSRNSRTRLHNIVTHLPGIRAPARIADHNQTDKVWNLLFTDEMIGLIVRWTNVKLENMSETYKRADKPELKPIDDVEMKAFVGLLFYTAIFKSNNEDISSIFATDGTGRDIFRLVMSQKRFAILLSCMRFDNPEDRVMRKLSDPAAAISELFNTFFQNAQNVFTIGEYACVDEMLVGFRGRCGFKMYMPAKPNKYGLKVMMLTNARSGYAYNVCI